MILVFVIMLQYLKNYCLSLYDMHFAINLLLNLSQNIRQQVKNPMGSQPPKKHLSIPNLSQQLQKCQQLSSRECPIYGPLHRVSYKNQQFEIGPFNPKSSVMGPSEWSLHYVISPNILMVPEHVLLERYEIPQYEGKKCLLQLVYEICEIEEGVNEGLGLSCNKIALSRLTNKWCVVGDIDNPLWNYQALLKQPNTPNSIYFSPQLMHAFSKDKLYPKLNIKQSDVFILAVMVLELVVGRRLVAEVYNYQGYEIRLEPILGALGTVEELYGRELYEMLVRMLELEPEARLTFKEIKQEIDNINRTIQGCYLSPINPKFTNITPPPNIKPKIDSFQPSPQIVKNVEEHTRGRSPGVIKKNLPITDRENGKKSFSPIKPIPADEVDERNSLIYHDRRKRISNQYRITPNRVKIWQGMEKQRPKVEPFGLKNDNQTSRVEKKSFSKLKTIRF